MQRKPTGLRLIFWKVWGWRFNRSLKKRFKELERRGHYGPKTVENVTKNMLNAAAQDLYDSKAINNNFVFWNNAWVSCEVRRKNGN
jgi:hypothetical protein